MSAQEIVMGGCLIVAAEYGHSDEEAEAIVNLLLKAGADITVKDSLGKQLFILNSSDFIALVQLSSVIVALLLTFQSFRTVQCTWRGQFS